MLDIPLLKFLSNKGYYDRFKRHVKSHTVVRETMMLLDDYAEYWKVFSDNDPIDFTHFKVWHKMVQHPGWDAARYEMYDTIFERITTEPPVDKAVIDKFIALDYTAQVREVCDRVIRGDTGVSLDYCSSILDKYVNELSSAGKTDEDYFVTNDLTSILNDLVRSHGLEWRLEDLNISIGPVHGGDFLIVSARPETGKTTFITSEFTHMAQQLPEDKKAIIFNNEEDGRKIWVRCIQSALAMTLLDIAVDEDATLEKYKAALGTIDRIKVVDKEGMLSVYDLERYLKGGEYSLVGINILDKLRGFDRDENDVSRMRKIAQFVRNLATKYKCTIVGIMQADASAEGKAWLDLSQMYGSKTGVQGEADAIVMIGNIGDDSTRYISVAKNKLPGGPRTQPDKRHGKFEVYFDGERGRYSSKTY